MDNSKIQAKPRNSFMGWIADGLKSANNALDIKSPNYKPGDMHLPIGGLLGLGALGNVADHASYGDSPFAPGEMDVTNSPFPTFKAGRGEDIRDAAMAVAPFAGPAARLAGSGARAGGLAIAKSANQAVMEGTGPLSKLISDAARPAFAIKPKGGNWDERGMDQFLRGIVDGKSPATIDWANSNLKKYIKNSLGTESDPIFALNQKHLADGDLSEMSQMILGPNRPEQVLKQAGGTHSNQDWERLSDSAIGATPTDSIHPFDAQYQPWMANAPEGTMLYDLNRNPKQGNTRYRLGFQDMLEHIESSGMSPEDLKRSPVQLIAKMMADKRAADEAAKAAIVIPPGTHAQSFDSGNQMVRLDKPHQFARESDDMGHSVRGYEPTDGTGGEGGSEGYGTGSGGWLAIQNGTARVHSLRDAKGKPLVTIESQHPIEDRATYKSLQDLTPEEQHTALNVYFGRDAADTTEISHHDFNDYKNNSVVSAGEGKWTIGDQYPSGLPTVTQVKGPRNNLIDPQHLPDVVDYLNKNHAESNIRKGDFTDNGIIDTMNFPDIWSHEPEFLTLLDDVAGGNRFVDKDTVDKVYQASKNYLNEKPGKLPSEVQESPFDDPHGGWEPQ